MRDRRAIWVIACGAALLLVGCPFTSEDPGYCAACTEENPCGKECTSPTPVCDVTNHVCVACKDNAVCTTASASRCDMSTGGCAACMIDDDCAHLTGTGVCDNGTCVQCARDKESACGTNVCDLSTKQCTDRAEKSADLCQPCANDRQCKDGRVCVMTTFKDPATADAPAVEVGRFCLWNKDAASVDDGKTANQCPRPYVGVSENISTANGTTATVCSLRVTTCTALTDYSMKMCGTSAQPPQPDDAMCGVANQPDGFCGTFPADSSYRCTVPCGSNDDCFAGFTCTASKRCAL